MASWAASVSDHPHSGGLPPAAERLRSYVASRFDIQLPVLLVFVAFVVAVSIFLFREIAADRLRISGGARPISFLAESAEGLAFGSDLICRGLTVGRVRAVRVDDASLAAPGEGIGFRIEGALDKPYANWLFKDNPVVRAGIGPSYLGLASIDLDLAGIAPARERPAPQVLTLRFEEGRLGRMQDRVGMMLEVLVQPSEMLGQRVASGRATSLERTFWNLDRFTEKLDAAATTLTVDTDSPSPLSQFVQSTDKLATLVDELGAQVRDLTAESTRAVRQSQAAIDKLDATISRLERSSLEVLGETPAQRRAIHSGLLETIGNMREVSDDLKDLMPRIGDTGLGRMLIKKKPSPTPEKKPRR
jgi:hypothetical protein